MIDFKNIEEVRDYIESLLNVNNKDITDIKPYYNIFKLSAERLSKKFNINTTKLVKDFNRYKKKIHKKIIIYEKVIKFRDKLPEPSIFLYSGVKHTTKIAVCSNFFESKYKHRKFSFYPDVKYSYVELSNTIVLFPIINHTIKLYSTKKEFYDNFIDIREYRINQIID